MMRSIVCGALCVCSVAKTRWPVSAAVSAVAIVSRSLISPTRITSGSWRNAARNASAKVVASGPISRWLTMQVRCQCRNSIGSSIVRMCSCRVRLTWSSSDASVVDLPEPVGPVTSTRPRGLSASSYSRSGRFSCSSVLISAGIKRNAAPMLARWKYALTRNRARPGNRVREVELPFGLELLLLLGRDDPVHEVAGLVPVEVLVVGQALEAAVDPDHRRGASGQMEIRRVPLDHDGEQFVDRVHGCWHGSLVLSELYRHSFDASAAPLLASADLRELRSTGDLALGAPGPSACVRARLRSRGRSRCRCRGVVPGSCAWALDRPGLAANASPQCSTSAV